MRAIHSLFTSLSYSRQIAGLVYIRRKKHKNAKGKCTIKNTPQTTTTASIKKKPKTGYIKWIVIAAIVLAVVIAAIIILPKVFGVLFGGYTAAKASRLQPIDALHTT